MLNAVAIIMINCPHCGELLIDTPKDIHKLSKQQAAIINILSSRPGKIWNVRAIASILYSVDPDGGAVTYDSVIPTQIHRIRKRIGDIIETTGSGYRLRINEKHVTHTKSTTESETK